jgi:hypothetical protein
LAKVTVHEDGAVSFECPGCGERHGININPRHRWEFNGDKDRPTIRPSILVRSGYYCHSFVTDGKIQYLSDCTHRLAGQTVEMLDEEL